MGLAISLVAMEKEKVGWLREIHFTLTGHIFFFKTGGSKSFHICRYGTTFALTEAEAATTPDWRRMEVAPSGTTKKRWMETHTGTHRVEATNTIWYLKYDIHINGWESLRTYSIWTILLQQRSSNMCVWKLTPTNYNIGATFALLIINFYFYLHSFPLSSGPSFCQTLRSIWSAPSRSVRQTSKYLLMTLMERSPMVSAEH